jgi:hypothetical protein
LATALPSRLTGEAHRLTLCHETAPTATAPAERYGNSGGATRFLVACSNAYASSIGFGSLHAVPVNVTLNDEGFGSNPGGWDIVSTSPASSIASGIPSRRRQMRASVDALSVVSARSGARLGALHEQPYRVAGLGEPLGRGHLLRRRDGERRHRELVVTADA